MSAVAVIRAAWRLGVQLRAVNGQIEFAAPAGVPLDTLIVELRASKDEVLRLLRWPDQLCRQVWEHALEEISSFWTVKTTLLSDQEKDAWWLEEAIDYELQRAVRTAILADDVDATHAAVEEWEQAWRAFLFGEKKFPKQASLPSLPSPPSPPSPAREQVSVGGDQSDHIRAGGGIPAGASSVQGNLQTAPAPQAH